MLMLYSDSNTTSAIHALRQPQESKIISAGINVIYKGNIPVTYLLKIVLDVVEVNS
jgi:hypothetical protein